MSAYQEITIKLTRSSRCYAHGVIVEEHGDYVKVVWHKPSANGYPVRGSGWMRRPADMDAVVVEPVWVGREAVYGPCPHNRVIGPLFYFCADCGAYLSAPTPVVLPAMSDTGQS